MALFTDIPLATLKTYRSEAQAALHQILLFKKVARVTSSDGKTVAFGPTDIKELKSYIQALDQAISITEGAAAGTSSGAFGSVAGTATWTR